MIKAVIFDVGGVLVRTEDRSPRHAWDAKLGLAPGETEEIVFNSEMGQAAQRGEVSDEALWAWIGKHLALGDELEAFRAAFWQGDVLDEALIAWIRTLRPTYQTAIISNATDVLRSHLTNNLRIADAFDLIVGSAEEGIMKPRAEIYERTLARLGREPHETVFIDDFAHNIAAARELGMAAIHYQPGVDLIAEFAQLGVIPDDAGEPNEGTRMFTTKPFTGTSAEYEAIVAIDNELYPESPFSAETLAHIERHRQTKYYFQRTLIYQGERLIGSYAVEEPHWAYEPGKFHMVMSIAADVESVAMRSAVWNHLLDQLADHQPTKLLMPAREDKQAHVDFLLARGFKPAMRFQESQLALADFDAAKFGEAVDRVTASGIRILPLSELMDSDADWQRKFYDMDVAIMADIPYPDPIEPSPFEIFVKKELESPSFLPQGIFVAVDGDTYVGFSSLMPNHADPRILQTGTTGTLRDYRRRGLATAMKVEALQFAQAYGAHFVNTENEENNPMYQLNLMLGFKPLPAWIEFRQTLASPEAFQALYANPVVA